MLKFTYLFLFILTISACSAPVVIDVDNPTDSEVHVVIDRKKSVVLRAKSNKKIQIESGTRKVSVNGGKPISITLKKNTEYLLNPTNSDYYIETIRYSASDEDAVDSSLDSTTSIIGSLEVYGQYEKVNQFLIPKAWHFGVNQTPSRRARSNRSRIKVMKLHRGNELEAKYIKDFFKKAFEN